MPDFGALLRGVALDAVADATVGNDESASTNTLSRVVLDLLDHVETAAADVARREQAESEEYAEREERTRCLQTRDFRMSDGMPLTRYLALLIAAADRALCGPPKNVAMKTLGIKERVKTRGQTIAFREAAANQDHGTDAATDRTPLAGDASSAQDSKEPQSRRASIVSASDGPVATEQHAAADSGSSSDDADERDSHEADWSSHWVGAEVAVEACALLQLVGLTLTAETLFRLLAAAFLHTTYLFALRATAAFKAGPSTPGGALHASLSRYDRRCVATATLDAFAERVAFSAGCCDDEELLEWHDALCYVLPEEMRGRLDDARADAEKGATILQRRHSMARRRSFTRRRSSVASAGRSSAVADEDARSDPGGAGHSRRDSAASSMGGTVAIAAHDDDDEDALDAEYYRRGNAEKKTVVAFYYVLAELQQLDGAWAAWVPERSAAARTTRGDAKVRRASQASAMWRRSMRRASAASAHSAGSATE